MRLLLLIFCLLFFFFNDTATTEIYTLSLHDALPISAAHLPRSRRRGRAHHPRPGVRDGPRASHGTVRSEEHTSELQSRLHLVCRLLLEKKKKLHTPIPALYASRRLGRLARLSVHTAA